MFPLILIWSCFLKYFPFCFISFSCSWTIILFFCVKFNKAEARHVRTIERAVIVVATLAVVFWMLLLVGFYICRSRINLKSKITLLWQPLQTYGWIVLCNSYVFFSLYLSHSVGVCVCELTLNLSLFSKWKIAS